jgi:ATP-dependent DNA helicase RecG
MKSKSDIEKLLPELDRCVADDLEGQDLDFKLWDDKSRDKAVKTVVRMAVCMANGGGGTVVFGIGDRIQGREKAILGVPYDINTDLLKKAVYDQTDPKITPVFEEFSVPEGTGRLILMQIYPGMPPYTDTSGYGTVRIGKDCQPLTGTIRRKIGIETGESDYTADIVCSATTEMLSITAVEILQGLARRERAPEDLLGMSALDMLETLGLIKHGKMTRAAALLAGTESAVRQYVPGHSWTFLQMMNDADYSNRSDGTTALLVSIQKIEELLVPLNPITSYKQGLFHYEYRTWPEIAVREALMNAFCHADFTIAGPVMVKLFPKHLEISNNGGFIAGITPENILHHPPAARNPLLVEALTRLRLVNRSNLGIGRMFQSLLVEGKEPPNIIDRGNSVTITFYKRDFDPLFRMFAAEADEKGEFLGVDEMLVLRFLLQHPEIETTTAAQLCQRNEIDMRERLSSMEKYGWLEHGGTGRGSYWSMDPRLYRRLSDVSNAEKRRRIDWNAAKTRILSILMEREKHGEGGLSNQEIRRITLLDRNQAYRLISELRKENPQIQGGDRGRYAKYIYLSNVAHKAWKH